MWVMATAALAFTMGGIPSGMKMPDIGPKEEAMMMEPDFQESAF